MIDDLPEYRKRQSLILQKEVQEASDEVHALAVVEGRVDDCVGIENAPQVLVADVLVVFEGPMDVHFNVVLDPCREIEEGLLLVHLELGDNVLRVYLQQFEPQGLPLPLNPVLIGSQQRLLEHFSDKNVVEIFGHHQNVAQRDV